MKYFLVLARWPALVIFAVLFFALFSLVVISFNIKFLNFSDPGEGVPSKHTELSDKLNTIFLLAESQELSRIPNLPQFNTTIFTLYNYNPDEVYDIECKPSRWKSLFKIMLETKGADDTMLDLPHVQSLCKFADRIKGHELVNKSCGVVSLLNTIEDVTGATCGNVGQNHVTKLVDVLKTCREHYTSGILNGIQCDSDACRSVPQDCFKVYHLFYYFADEAFHKDESLKLKRTLLMFPLRDWTKPTAKKFYLDTFASNPYQSDSMIKVIGIDSFIKAEAMHNQLNLDIVYMGVAMAFVGIIMMLYLRSLVLTLVAAVDAGLSIVLAYFLYVGVFQIKFFPFMNLLSGLIVIALVADDVFLFAESMEAMKENHPNSSLEFLMRSTFRHAGSSVFATSLTTTASFFSNVVSTIPAAKCFGIYAGLCIMCNFLLMCTFIPASMMLLERRRREKEKKMAYNPKKPCCDLSPVYNKISAMSDYVFKVACPKIINYLHPVFILVLLGVGLTCGMLVFYKPKFSLPTDSNFQAFILQHPMEGYDRMISEFKFFDIEKTFIPLPAQYVWGVTPIDTASSFNPSDRGDLILNHSFDLTEHANQKYLSSICETLKRNHTASKDMICTMTEYLEAFEKCRDPSDPCCCEKEKPECFSQCFPVFMSRLYAKYPSESITGTPYFDEYNEVKAYKMQFVSSYVFELDYESMKSFVEFMDAQWEYVKGAAPESMKHVYFTSILGFYDTQGAFLNGAFASAGISLLVCFICVLVATRNFIITIFCILTIGQSTLGLYACMILLEWKLNIVESTILSLTLGLTIDFVIHFSVAYLLSTAETRQKRVEDVLSLVGSPAVLAALTTFAAGASMLPSVSYSFYQLGLFLMLVMVISIIYSIFFFLSLCRLCGPLKNFCQIPLPCGGGSELDDDSKLGSDRSGKRLVNKHDRPKFSGQPVYQVSRGSMYDTVDQFLWGKHHRSYGGAFSDRHFPNFIPRPAVSKSSRPTVSNSSRPKSRPDVSNSSGPDVSNSSRPKSRPDVSNSSRPKSRPDVSNSSRPKSRPEVSNSSRPKSRPDVSNSSRPKSRPEVSNSSRPKGKPDVSNPSRPKSRPDVSNSRLPAVLSAISDRHFPNFLPRPAVSNSSSPVVSDSSRPAVPNSSSNPYPNPGPSRHDSKNKNNFFALAKQGFKVGNKIRKIASKLPGLDTDTSSDISVE